MFLIEKRAERILQEIGSFIYRKRINLDLKIKCSNDSEYRDFVRGEHWGGRDVTVWLKCDEVTVPEQWSKDKLALYLNITDYSVQGVNPEALIYINGQAVQGCDKNHREIVLPKHLIADKRFKLDIKAFSGFRHYTNKYVSAELVAIDPRAEKLYFLLKTTIQTAFTFQKDEYYRDAIFAIIERAINTIDWRQPGEEAHYELMEEAGELIKNELKKLSGNPNRPVITCVGHSHIDVAWYWMLKHTREKCSRTFSTVLNLMEQYPEYQYIQSQAKLYQYLKKDYPEIYERIKEKVKEGRWEANGGMWVEADCNVSSGESLVRQLLFGTRFFRQEFGVENKTLWLPDAFGFNANLAQILNKSGFRYFVTTKLGWNQFNRPPYDNFIWKGLDGSSVLANLMTIPEHPNDETSWAYSYNSEVTPNVIKRMWKSYRHIDINNQELLMTYGHGDGGGGTTREMIECLKNTEYMPSGPICQMGKAEPFLDRLEKRIKDNPHLPSWDGELYLEMHRGTLTSQAKNKWYNRKSEIALHDVEALHSLAAMTSYPQAEINENWDIVLLNQFHDIIPGSSIREVYEESLQQYEGVMNNVTQLKNKGLSALASKLKLEQKSLVIFNSLSWNRSDYIYVEKLEDMAFADNGKELAAQLVTINKKPHYMLYIENVPSYGYKVVQLKTGKPLQQQADMLISKDTMENRFFKISLNEKGHMTSIFDKVNQREVLQKGTLGNVLTAYEDKPVNFDAWDIDIYYKDKKYVIDDLESIEVVDTNSERGTLRLEYKYMNSTILQYIHLYDKVSRIDFETEIDWKEKQTLVKASFPVDIRSTKATYDIQFGSIERNTHYNTPWDYGKFEASAQKWADLSERKYGVSLLNDSKYGYSIKDNVMELTLLKSAIEPDPLADKCYHNFVYSLYPHRGDWFEGSTVQAAYELNMPMLTVVAEKNHGQLESTDSFIRNTADTVILETVKKAEDSDALIIRAYEYSNGKCTGDIIFNREIKAAYACDMMERNLIPIAFIKNTLPVSFIPFELKCFMVELV